jgi:Conjugative transposon protein TcpC
MVRRAILDRSAQSTAHVAGAEAAPGAPDPAGGTAARTGPRWRGAGSRWLIWASRAVLWAVLLVIGYRGVTAIVSTPAPSAPASPAPGAGTHGFPVSMAEAYAMQFGQVYLNFSPATAGQRATQLAAFLPPGSDAQLGWNGAGSLQLQSEQVAAISVQDSQHATVTLLARANGQLMELGVPVYSANGGLAISAEPSLLPPPAHVTPPVTQPAPSDPATAAALSGQLPAFFRAYASGDPVTLGRFLAPGASVTGLGGTVTYGAITGIDVPPGGTTRHITVSVIWKFSGQAAQPSASRVAAAKAGVEMTYRMTVVQQNGSWDVAAIGPSSQPLAPP